MNTLNSQHRIPGVHFGNIIEAGNLDDADALVVGEIIGFDAESNAITFKLEDVRAAKPEFGGKCVVRVNTL